jgi:acetyltransferase-like isoleucine patch superfamily enzyme
VNEQASDDGGHFDHCPWLFAKQATAEQRTAQAERQRRLVDAMGVVRLGEDCFVAETAAVYPEHLELGDRSYIAAHAYVTDDVRTGADCTINPFAVVRGTVRLGDGVRIGAHSSLFGFNHGAAPELPVHQQPVTSKGITVGDDVWIGSQVVIIDGVEIGDHCVIGAGAVVTKDLPAWTIAAGNPARRLRDRRESRGASAGSGSADARRLADQLPAFAETARSQASDLIERCWLPELGRYVDRPGTAPTVRAQCDAIEVADLLLGAAPPRLTAEEHIARLHAAHDPAESLDGPAAYHVLCVGYALDLLGSSFAHPIRPVLDATADEVVRKLTALPWRDRAWHAGSWVDAWATAAHWNRRLGAEPETPGALEALFGWLHLHVDPWTGMWGSPSADEGRLQMVNGFYRLTRGSFAQIGLPVPHPERVIDTVLDHTRDQRWFAPGRENACNILDVVHPLWLCGRQTSHRIEEARAWAASQITAAVARWQPGRGFGFGPSGDGSGPGREPGLQGTEMWLAIVWLLADVVGASDLLGYRPRGVHRPEPAVG